MVFVGKDAGRSPRRDWIDEALELADEIEGLVGELPERAEEFAMSVSEQSRDIAKRVEETRGITKGEIEALRNMADGCRRWLER